MNDMLVVQEFESEKSLSEDVLTDVLSVSILHHLDDWCHGKVHELYEDPESLSVVEGLVHLQDEVCASTHVHEGDLVVHQHLFAVVFRLNEFEGAD